MLWSQTHNGSLRIMPVADFDTYLEEVKQRPAERDLLDVASARIELGLRLAELRAAHGVTQTELAARSGVPQSEISRIETGRANPTVKTVSALGAAFGLQLAWTPVADD